MVAGGGLACLPSSLTTVPLKNTASSFSAGSLTHTAAPFASGIRRRTEPILEKSFESNCTCGACPLKQPVECESYRERIPINFQAPAQLAGASFRSEAQHRTQRGLGT